MKSIHRILVPAILATVFLSIIGRDCFAEPRIDTAKLKRPNIVFIFTDDQRYDALGAAGNPIIQTPNLDRLAARGTLFREAFVTLSICSPSRAACLTGMYGSRNGVTTLGKPVHGKTFAQLLKDCGYRTGMMGKWHLGNTPEQLGFDQASYFISNGPYYNRPATVDGKRIVIKGFIDDWVADRSIEFIESASRSYQPFVLWMCTQVPHMNHKFDWNAREETLALYDQDKMQLPATWQDRLEGKPPYLKTARSRTKALEYGYDDPAKIRRHLQRYYAAITEVDRSIGRVLDAIDRLELTDETWFLFMGDNGWHMGEHGFTSKVLAYEPSMRVPMIVVGPGTKARIDDHLVLNIDLCATILDLACVVPPQPVQGRSLLPIVQGEPLEDWRKDFLYESPDTVLGVLPHHAVRNDRWKYIETKTSATTSFCELYDLANDPNEMKNLIDTELEQAKALANRLEELRQQVEPPRQGEE